MNRRPILSLVATLVLAAAFLAGSASPAFARRALSREEKDLLESMTEASRQFEILRIDRAARELKLIIDARPSPVFARKLRATATKEVLASMRDHEELGPMAAKILDLAEEGDEQVLEDPAFFDAVVEGVMSEDRRERAESYEDLRILGERVAPALVARLLTKRDPEERTRIVLALGELRSAATLALAATLEGDNYVLVQNAVRLLGDARDRRAIPELVRLYHNTVAEEHKEVIAAALDRIARLAREEIPSVQEAYRAEIDRILSEARDYSTSPSRDWAAMWWWEASSKELVMEKVSRDLYRELMARRMIQRGLAAGHSPELTAFLPALCLRISAKLGARDTSALRLEADRLMHLAGARRMLEALTGAVEARDVGRMLIALDVLYDLGRAGARLAVAAEESTDVSPDEAAWRSAYLAGDVEVRFAAARTAVAMRRPLDDPLGRTVVRTLLANLRFATGAGRALAVISDAKLANEAATLIGKFPLQCDVVADVSEAVTALSEKLDYAAVVVHHDHLEVLARMGDMGLLGAVPTICLAPHENEILYRDKADGLITLPLVPSMSERVTKALLPPAGESQERANEALDRLIEAKELAGLGPDCFAGILGDLAVRGDKTFRMKLLPVLSDTADGRDLVGLRTVFEGEDYSKEERLLALSVTGRILSRHPEAETADVKNALTELVRSDDPDLAGAAACALNTVSFSDEEFADMFGRIAPEKRD